MLSPHCLVVGDPIAHSLSPVLHRAAYSQLGVEWNYSARRVSAGGLAAALSEYDEALRGVSVTMPLKREALGLATAASDQARQAGVANTLVRRDGGWWAANTDIPGAVAATRERATEEFEKVVIVGGGATAMSMCCAAAELGARRVELVVRAPDRLPQLDALTFDVEVSRLDDRCEFAADLLMSTIPAAAQTPELVQRARSVPAVFDVTYDPWPTPLMAAAEDRILITGLDLLVHQAALQCELFTGRRGSVGVMRTAGLAALGR